MHFSDFTGTESYIMGQVGSGGLDFGFLSALWVIMTERVMTATAGNVMGSRNSLKKKRQK